MGKMSRDKGAAFEREVARIFGVWCGHKLTRTPLSGGWARDRDDVSGDLVPADLEVATWWPLHIECKKQEGWSLDAIVAGKCVAFHEWWEQTTTQCPIDKIPLLVFARNRVKPCVAMQLEDMSCVTGDLSRLEYYLVLQSGWTGCYTVITGLSHLLDTVAVGQFTYYNDLR